MTIGSSKIPVYVMLVVVSVLLLFPFYWLISSSLKSRACISMMPPAYYPCKTETVDINLPAQERVVTAQGESWFLLCRWGELIGDTNDGGGYYVQLDNFKPTSMVTWLADSAVKPADVRQSVIRFSQMPIHTLKSSGEHIVLVGRIVRQKQAGFDEIIFTLPKEDAAKNAVKPLLNAAHHEVRDFSPRWTNYPETLKGPEATFGRESTGFAVFMRNSFFISIMAVIGQVLSSSLVAFGFARLRFRGRELLFILLLATMMIPAQVTLFPLFAFYKWLGWIDSFLPLIVPHFTAGAFNVFLVRQYMLTIPRELEESAEIDGCGPLRRYFHIILPNSIPVLIVVALFTFVYAWQDVLGPLIYLDNPSYRTVTLGLEYFRSPYVDNRHLLMTGAVLAMLPVAILFIFLQRYIMSGIATTGLKS